MTTTKKIFIDIIDTPIFLSLRTGKKISVVKRYLRMKYGINVEDDVLNLRLKNLKKCLKTH